MLQILASIMIIASCHESDLSTNENAISEDFAFNYSYGDTKIPVHENTSITIVNENEHLLKLPDDVFYIAKSANSDNFQIESIISTSEAGVRCKCTSGSGCNPTKYNGKYSCVMLSTCTTCKLTTTSISGGGSNNIYIKGIVDYNKGISIQQFEPIEGDSHTGSNEIYGNAFSELFEIDRVQSGINEFFTSIYGNDIPQFIYDNEDEIPEEYVYVKINIYGNIAAMPISRKLVSKQAKFGRALITDDISCKCHSGDEGCVKKTAGLGKVKYCESENCTDCELVDSQ